jgi:hypothetical protein
MGRLQGRRPPRSCRGLGRARPDGIGTRAAGESAGTVAFRRARAAEGTVGVQLVEGNHGWSSHALEYFAVGTAVVPTSDTHEIPPPSLVLSLNDERQSGFRGF